jgi:hypothetical protein
VADRGPLKQERKPDDPGGADKASGHIESLASEPRNNGVGTNLPRMKPIEDVDDKTGRPVIDTVAVDMDELPEDPLFINDSVPEG